MSRRNPGCLIFNHQRGFAERWQTLSFMFLGKRRRGVSKSGKGNGAMSPARIARSILLVAVVFSVSGAASLLQAADETPATSTTPAAAASPSPKVDSGDNAWMLTSSALVLMMTGPGLALFYCGLVRKKNVLSVMMQCIFLMCLMTRDLGPLWVRAVVRQRSRRRENARQAGLRIVDRLHWRRAILSLHEPCDAHVERKGPDAGDAELQSPIDGSG